MNKINLYGSEWEEIDFKTFDELSYEQVELLNIGSGVNKIKYYKKIESPEDIAVLCSKDSVIGKPQDTNSLDASAVVRKEEGNESIEAVSKTGLTPDIINLNDYKEVDLQGYANHGGEAVIHWKNNKQIFYIKKENKFPKVLENEDYKFEIGHASICILDKKETTRMPFDCDMSLPLLIQAVKYYKENKDE